MQESANLLDIIIVNYKSTGLLIRCLGSVYDSTNGIPIRTFVQDNDSRDGVDRASATFPQINLTKNSCNMGFAKAVNRALEQGTAPYVLLLNPDTIVSNGFFESVLKFIEGNQDVGIVGSKILNKDGTVQGSARRFPTPFTALFGRATLLTRLFPNNRFSRANVLTTRSDGRTPMEVDWVSGACMLLRRKALDEASYLDDRFFLYWEDADLCRRVRESGWKVVYFPQASVWHCVGGSSQKRVFRSAIDFHKSSYRLFDKYAKGLLRIIKPLVIAGLSFRLLLVLIHHANRRLANQVGGTWLLAGLRRYLSSPEGTEFFPLKDL